MDNLQQLIDIVLVASVAYFAYRDFLYRQAFKALGISNIPNLHRQMNSEKVKVARLEEQIEDVSYKLHGMSRDIEGINKRFEG